MATRRGYLKVRMQDLHRIVNKERQGLRDIYVRPSETRLDIRNSLAPLHERFEMHLPEMGESCRFTPHSLSQLAGKGGVPMPFLERVPAALGLRAMRCMLELHDEQDDRSLLFRLREGRPWRIRGILSVSAVRVSDVEIVEDILQVIDRPAWIGYLNVTEDALAVRILLDKESLNVGFRNNPDTTVPGLDILSSETGRYPLQIRQLLWRLVCSNGLTSLSAGPRYFRGRSANFDRERFRTALGNAMEASLTTSKETVGRLIAARGEFVARPLVEVEKLFKRYRLGSYRGERGRWVRAQLAGEKSLFGVDRFAIVQAFTAVARGLEHDTRRRWEDAMSEYLYQEAQAA